MSEIQKSLKSPIGAAWSSLFGNFSQIFSFFFYDGSPNTPVSVSVSLEASKKKERN